MSWTCPTSTWSSAAAGPGKRAATTRTGTGRAPPPGCCRACSRGGRPVRCSSPTADRRPPCARRRPPCAGRRAPALAGIDPITGLSRLSCPRAEYLFKQASELHAPLGKGDTLHQLQHSGLKHLAEKGRSVPELQAKSRHKHLGTLGRDVKLGEETSARITAENDEYIRRRQR
ncbi:hypothetical protein OG991_41280 [Streptomyces mirabilis]|nr:hypothetical protein [Streptomyces mirabilis]